MTVLLFFTWSVTTASMGATPQVDGGWPHIGTLLLQERWGEWVLFRLQRSLYVQYKLIGPPYFLEWNGVPLYSTKQTEGQRLSLCQLCMEPSVVLACLLVITTALETGLLNLSANFCPVIRRCTASTHIFAVVSSSDHQLTGLSSEWSRFIFDQLPVPKTASLQQVMTQWISTTHRDFMLPSLVTTSWISVHVRGKFLSFLRIFVIFPAGHFWWTTG